MKFEMQFDAAIHQPDFLPWLGLFDKLFSAKTFIVFDNVQISSGKSWSSRVKILLGGKEHWLTIPVKKSGRTGQRIYETEVLELKKNWEKILKTIKQAYGRSPFFNETFAFLNEEIKTETELLGDFNLQFMEAVIRKLGNQEMKIVKCSDYPELRDSDKTATDMIVSVCEHFSVRNYYSGSGCLSFLEVNKFTERDISISFQKFEHPQYRQTGTAEFVPGLSVIDSLMNVGFSGVGEFLIRVRTQ